jgi:hypothetical protein
MNPSASSGGYVLTILGRIKGRHEMMMDIDEAWLRRRAARLQIIYRVPSM